MLYNITFSQAAEDDLLAASIWYEQQRIGLGKEFVQAVKMSAQSIQSNPVICISPEKYPGYPV